MRTSKVLCRGVLALALLMPFAVAQAAPEDEEAVVKAKMEYEQAMKGHDVGLQNAMKIQLAVQLAKAKSRAKSEKVDDSGSAKSSSSRNL